MYEAALEQGKEAVYVDLKAHRNIHFKRSSHLLKFVDNAQCLQNEGNWFMQHAPHCCFAFSPCMGSPSGLSLFNCQVNISFQFYFTPFTSTELANSLFSHFASLELTLPAVIKAVKVGTSFNDYLDMYCIDKIMMISNNEDHFVSNLCMAYVFGF